MTRTRETRPRVALLIDTLWDDFETRLWRGVVNEARTQDVSLICFAVGAAQSPYSASAQRNVLNDLVGPANVDGVLAVSGCIGAFLDPESLGQYLQRFAALPMICLSSDLTDFPCVRVDNRSGMRDLVSHFIVEHGCRRIAYIGGPEANFDAQERFAAYREALTLHGLPFDPMLVANGNFTPESGGRALSVLLKERGLNPDAVVAANDSMALDAIRVLREFGIGVPGNILVGGFDDIPDGRGQLPSLTTVRQPTYELGRHAMAEMARWLKTGEPAKSRVLPTRVVVRGTCGCLDQRNSNSTTIVSSIVATNTAPTEEHIRLAAEKLNNRFALITDILGHDRWAQALTQSCLADYRAPSGALRAALTTMMQECESSEMSSSIWCEVLHYLFSLLESHSLGSGDVRDSAFLYVSQYAEMKQIQNWAEYATQTVILQRFQQPVATAFSVETLKTILEETLPRLHINGFCLSLYEDGAINTKGRCYPMVQMTQTMENRYEGRVFAAGEMPHFPADELVPGGLQHGDKARLVNVMPLFFENEQFGFSVFEMGVANPTAFEVINSHLISIVRGFRLLEETRNYTHKLQHDVETRTADLQSKNREIEKLNQELIQKNRMDVLTNLYNRGAVFEFLKKELSRTRRRRLRDREPETGEDTAVDYQTFSVLMCDVDHFKRINDTYGHMIGDQVLKTIGELLRDYRVFRQEDVPGRFGGEEFIVVLASVDAENAAYPAQRFCEMLKAIAFPGRNSETFSVTVSIGISQYHDDDPNEEVVIRRADEALYYAKNHGRDQIVIYEKLASQAS